MDLRDMSLKSLWDSFRRSEQPGEALAAADELLDEYSRTTGAAEARKHAEWRRLTAITVAQKLYEANPVGWVDMGQERMTEMATRWMTLRDLVRAGCNPEMAVRS